MVELTAEGDPLLPHLQYWLVTSGEDVAFTPFQGFGLDITGQDFAFLIEAQSVFPASIVEIFTAPEVLPKLRLPINPRKAAIIGLPSLRAYFDAAESRSDIHVIVGLPKELAALKDVTQDVTTILASVNAAEGVLGLSGHSGNVAQVLDAHIRDALAPHLPTDVRRKLFERPLREPFQVGDRPSRIAGVTAPNEQLAASLGYVFNGAEQIDVARNEYVDAILDSVNHALDLKGEATSDIIVYAPSIVRNLYRFGSTYWNNTFRRIRSRALREMIKDGIFRNREYSGFTVGLHGEEPPENPYSDPVAGAILGLRQTELRLTAAGVGSLAANTIQPALRLPNAVNFHSAEMREIEQYSVRDDDRGRRLLQTAHTTLVGRMSDEIDDRLLGFIREKAEAITLVTDAPIEWLRIDGLPLMIRHEVSRIGMTPGNLMLAQCVSSGFLMIHGDQLLDVLVIRSFAPGDPIRRMLEAAIELFGLERVRVRVVDVANTEELISTLNSFQGLIAVFDCHGGHDGDDGHGWLKIGKEKVDVWQLADRARIPPIVILSACSTFALSGSHASVGNGLIRSGAITVVGTLLPVNAAKSAAFAARILYRIDAFIPLLPALDVELVTWRSLISTFFRMSYSTDLLHFFADQKHWISGEALREIGTKANQDINVLDRDWFESLLSAIASHAKRPITDIRKALDAEAGLVETMYYCQIGRPEMIGIYCGSEPVEKSVFAPAMS